MRKTVQEIQELVLYPSSGKTVEFVLTDYSYTQVQKAVLMIKRNLNDADSASVIAKAIYTYGNEHGIVVPDPDWDTNGTQGACLRFTFTELETAGLTDGDKLFTALKVWPNDGSPFSPKQGRRGVRIESPGVYQTA